MPTISQVLAQILLGAVLCELEHRRRKFFDRRRLLRHTSEQRRFLNLWHDIALSSELPHLEFGPHLGSGAFVSSLCFRYFCAQNPGQRLGSGANLLKVPFQSTAWTS